MTALNFLLFKDALLRMGVILPHGVVPLEAAYNAAKRPSDFSVTEEDWELWHWNPPQNTHHLNPDNTADAKPTWEEVKYYVAVVMREDVIGGLRKTCSEIITTQVFSEQTLEDERNVRLRALEAGTDISDKLAALAVYRTRYAELKKWVMGLTDLEQLALLDFSNDEYWAPTWSPPA